MRRVLSEVACALVVIATSSGCAKLKELGKKRHVEADLPPVSTVAASATTPPVWHPPEPPAAATASAAAHSSSAEHDTTSASAELAKARVAFEASDFKKVKALLEKKVRAGKGAREEHRLLYHACAELQDAACAAAIRTKHAADLDEPTD